MNRDKNTMPKLHVDLFFFFFLIYSSSEKPFFFLFFPAFMTYNQQRTLWEFQGTMC